MTEDRILELARAFLGEPGTQNRRVINFARAVLADEADPVHKPEAPAQYPELPDENIEDGEIRVWTTRHLYAAIDAAREQDRARAAAPPPAVGVSDTDILGAMSPHMRFDDGPNGDNSTDDALRAGRAVLALRASKPEAPDHRACTHPPDCSICNWCGFRAETPAKDT